MRKLTDILAEAEREDPRDLRSRSDARRERKAAEAHLVALARSLVSLSGRRLLTLDLPELVLDAVQDARRIASAIARERQLRLIRQRLREADHEAIAARLDAMLRPDGRPSPGARKARRWVERLLAEGDTALDELCSLDPSADRQRLRTLARAARQGGAKGQRPLRALSEAVTELLAREAAQPE